VGLLGHALTLRAGSDYEAMVKSRILDPLGLKSTRLTLSPEMKARLAIGHSPTLSPVTNWDLAALAGAGALRSTTNDILTFLAANLGYTRTPLAAAMAAEVSIRRPAGAPDMQIAYAWHVQTKDGKSIIWHNGGTGGYRTYMGYDPKSRVGVVVLSNIASAAGPDDIGRHLIDLSYPLQTAQPLREHIEVSVNTKVFDNYVGSYQLSPNVVLAISHECDQLFGQLTGQPKFPMFPEGEGKFFLRAVDAQVAFTAGPQGKARQATLHQNGLDMPAKRVEEAEIAAAAAALAKRVKDQTAALGSEAALRRNIEDLRLGQPKYELMGAGLAEITRQQLPQLKALVVQLGAVVSVTFKGVGPGGADIYNVKSENGSTEWRIILEADGKVASLGFRPI
jgi:serine-type D-Ala-D-Ala carboxypeptidase/endopeptidase